MNPKQIIIRKINTLFNLLQSASASNLRLELSRIAISQSAIFVNEHLTGAMFFGDRASVHEFALSRVNVSGLNLEFGVYQGKSITFLSKSLPERKFYGFDSFRGLKEDWAGTYMRKGHFNVNGKLPAVPKNVELVVGYFQDTLPDFLDLHPEPISFINFDCDTYESTRYVLSALKDRFRPGTIIIFDEFMGFHGWKQGEYFAWTEFILKEGIRFKYIAHSFEQVAIELID